VYRRVVIVGVLCVGISLLLLIKKQGREHNCLMHTYYTHLNTLKHTLLYLLFSTSNIL